MIHELKFLRPAILYKEEIEKECLKKYYSSEMFWYFGGIGGGPIKIATEYGGREWENYQFAIVDNTEKLMGYIAFSINYYISCACNFGLFSFVPGNNYIGYGIKEALKIIIDDFHLHRVEFRCIGGNPVERHYDKLIKNFAKDYIHNKVILHDVIKDESGSYHDELIYEIIIDYGKNKKQSYYESDEFKKRVEESRKIARDHFIECNLGYHNN